MKFGKNKFTQHTIVEDLDKYFVPKKMVWCKLDSESGFNGKKSGMRVFYVWVLSEDFRVLRLFDLETASKNLSLPTRQQKKKVVLRGKDLNTALSKIKSEKALISSTAIHDAIVSHNSLAINNSGWVSYQYDYEIPLPLFAKGKKIMSIVSGQQYKIARVSNNNNKLVLLETAYNIGDHKLAILHNRGVPV